MNDYQKITRAINYLVEHAQEQPDLHLLAEQAGLSPYHFQRKFSAWTGVSPKSFLQFLTLENAREMLKRGRPVQDVAWDSGLSGAGRLHDLCVNLEAATPGDIKSGGAGLQIDYGYGPTPFGECLLADTPRGICYLSFVPQPNHAAAFNELQQLWPHASYSHQPDKSLLLIQQVFKLQGGGRETALRGYVKGTRFQLRIWRALLQIPEGALSSYGEIAAAINQPAAARAVGSAVGANPLAYLIPCHRVIRNTGVIGAYRWGSNRKKIMLACEYARSPAQG